MPTSSPSLTPSRTPDKKRSTPTPVRTLARHAVAAALDKKARNIVVLDMREVSGVADYFVICTGDSDLQIKAIYEAIREEIKEACDERPWHREGTDAYQWVLVDYVDLVVHIFTEEKRAYYDLERLWGDAPMEDVADDGDAADVQMLRDEAA